MALLVCAGTSSKRRLQLCSFLVQGENVPSRDHTTYAQATHTTTTQELPCLLPLAACRAVCQGALVAWRL
jgi:hypothetical protein